MSIVLLFVTQPSSTRLESALQCELWRQLESWPSSVRETLGSIDEAFAWLVSIIYPTLPVEIRQPRASSASASTSLDRVMLVGESHTLALCWRSISTIQRTYLLQPLLTMGAKAFHFHSAARLLSGVQPSKCSKEAAIIEQHLRAIQRSFDEHQPTDTSPPPPRCVLIVAGEVDCRIEQGIALAVRKAKYPTLLDAICHTACAFVDGVLAITAHLGERVYTAIHPVRPPTNVDPESSRDLVAAFNAAVAVRAATARWLASCASTTPRRRLSVLLECFDPLIDEHGWLRSKYMLPDYQHLHADYVHDGAHDALAAWLSSCVGAPPLLPSGASAKRRYPPQCALADEVVQHMLAQPIASTLPEAVTVDASDGERLAHALFPHWQHTFVS